MTREEARQEMNKVVKSSLTDNEKRRAINSIFEKREQQEPCEDCIARQPLIDNWNSCADMLMNEGGAEIVMGWIFDLPSVTPTHKKGKWVEVDDYPHEEYECSVCGRIVEVTSANIKPEEEYPYCHCGAYMREVNEDEMRSN